MKSKLVKKKVQVDDDIIKQFNVMVGVDEPDPVIAEERYDKLYSSFDKLLRTFATFTDRISVKMPNFPQGGIVELRDFTEARRKDLDAAKLEPVTTATLANKYDPAVIPGAYMQLKECQFVQTAIVIAGNLKEYENNIADKNNLSGDFLDDVITFTPFPFSVLDIKMLYTLAPDNVRNYILQVLHFVYLRVTEIWQVYSTPDIDTHKFAQMMTSALSELRKYVPRCNEAFSAIANSVELFVENMPTYYKDLKQSNGNKSLIFENFVFDVSKKFDSNPRILGQFRKIMGKLRESMKGQSNPQVDKMFNLLDRQLNKGE